MRTLLLLCLLLCAAPLFASELRTWDLQHRSASEMIPMLRPMLEDGGAISGSGYTLIVRSSKENLAQIDTLVRQLDREPRMLLISVVQSNEREQEKSGASLSGSSSEGLRLRAYGDQRQEQDDGNQQVSVLEGQWAVIRTGQAVPQVVQQTHQTPTGTTVTRSIEYRDVDSGFEVRPTLVGKQVRVEIRPFRANLSSDSSGAIEQRTLNTTVVGKPGEWLELGGVSQQQNAQGTGIIYSNRERGTQGNRFRIKVDIVNP